MKDEYDFSKGERGKFFAEKAILVPPVNAGIGVSGKGMRMTARIASCSCGQLHLTCEGEPVRISICHCLECQKRTGSIFGEQARFPRERVTIEGRAAQWTRLGDSGQPATFHFCPVCGSTVYWETSGASDSVGVAVGAFADPNFPPPHVSVYEERRHPWALAAGQLPLEHQF